MSGRNRSISDSPARHCSIADLILPGCFWLAFLVPFEKRRIHYLDDFDERTTHFVVKFRIVGIWPDSGPRDWTKAHAHLPARCQVGKCVDIELFVRENIWLVKIPVRKGAALRYP